MTLSSKKLFTENRLALIGKIDDAMSFRFSKLRMLTIFLLIHVLQVNGQNEVQFKAFGYTPKTLNDSIYSALKSAKSQEKKLPILFEIGKSYVTYANADSLIFYSEHIRSTLASLKQNVDRPLYLAKSKYLLGEGKYLGGLYDDALKAYLEGITEIKKTGDDQITYMLQLGLGKVYVKKKMYEKAQVLLNNCLEQQADTTISTQANLFLGISSLAQENLALASSYFDSAENLVYEDNSPELALKISMAKAVLAIRETKYDLAFTLLENIINKSLSYNFFDIYTEGVLRYGGLSRELENYQVSEITLSTAYTNSLQWNRLDLRKQIINSLRKTYAAKGDFENAYSLMTQYITVSNEITEQQNSKAIQELEFKYQTLQKENQIFELKEEQLAKQTEIDRQKTIKKAFLYGFLVLLIPIIALLFVYYQKLQAQSELNLQQEELNTQRIAGLLSGQELNLAKAALEAQQEERTRIAQQLHDSIGGNLAGIKLQLANLENKHPLQQEIMGQVNETYELVRDISHDLIPKKFNQNAFTTLIYEYTQKIENSSEMEITFLAHPKDTINALGEPLKVELYQIIQELCTNTIKHAKAKTIELHITVVESILQVLFEDDGIGFHMDTITKGIGLNNIGDRLQLLNGNITMDSAVGRGTAVTIEIPLKNENI